MPAIFCPPSLAGFAAAFALSLRLAWFLPGGLSFSLQE